MDPSGKVVVVAVEWSGAEALATGLAARGATVVLVGPDAGAAGRLAAVIESQAAGRPAVFVTDGAAAGVDAVVAFVSELFKGP